MLMETVYLQQEAMNIAGLNFNFIFYSITFTIDHFTVDGLVTWPLNGSEAGVDLVLIQTSLLL